MGIGGKLGRRRSENRIKKKTLAASRPQVDPEAEIDSIIQPYVNRAYNTGKKIVTVTQARKAEGKQILKGWLKHGVGETYRTVMGPKPPQSSKRRKK